MPYRDDFYDLESQRYYHGPDHATQNWGQFEWDVFNTALTVGKVGYNAAQMYAWNKAREWWNTPREPDISSFEHWVGTAGDEENPNLRKRVVNDMQPIKKTKTESGMIPVHEPVSTMIPVESIDDDTANWNAPMDTISSPDFSGDHYSDMQPIEDPNETAQEPAYAQQLAIEAAGTTMDVESALNDITGKLKRKPMKYRVKDIVLHHHAKGSGAPGTKPVGLSGYRQIEFQVDGGRTAINADFTWNDKTELLRAMDFAIRNYMTQTQTGWRNVTAAANTEGTAFNAQLSSATIENNLHAFEMYHKKEYIITNQSNTDCSVVCRLITYKTNSALPLIRASVAEADLINNTTFEAAQYANAMPYNPSGIGSPAAIDLNSIIGTTDYRFNMFKHRYKVRKYMKELGVRIIKLKPGDSCVVAVVDKGPRLISRVALNELEANQRPAGYFRQMVFELRGTDIASHSATTEQGFSAAAIGILEKSTMIYKAVQKMNFRMLKFIEPASTDNVVTRMRYQEPSLIARVNQVVVSDDNQLQTAVQTQA